MHLISQRQDHLLEVCEEALEAFLDEISHKVRFLLENSRLTGYFRADLQDSLGHTLKN